MVNIRCFAEFLKVFIFVGMMKDKFLSGSKISTEFYEREDVVLIAKELLGKKLCTNINNEFTSGLIVETEAYKAPEDAASHAFQNRKTKRTAPFYESGGIGYVYLIYGMYKLFNIITNIQDIPHAILIRAVEPIDGLEIIKKRRNHNKIRRNTTGGPGLLTQALGITMKHNGISLQGNDIWVENGVNLPEQNIIASPRVGLGKNVPEPYLSMPWRFRIKDNKFTSPAK